MEQSRDGELANGSGDHPSRGANSPAGKEIKLDGSRQKWSLFLILRDWAK